MAWSCFLAEPRTNLPLYRLLLSSLRRSARRTSKCQSAAAWDQLNQPRSRAQVEQFLHRQVAPEHHQAAVRRRHQALAVDVTEGGRTRQRTGFPPPSLTTYMPSSPFEPSTGK